MAGEAKTVKSLVLQYKFAILATTASLLVIVGFILMLIPTTSVSMKEHVVDYTDCERFTIVESSMTCRDYLMINNDFCVCLFIFSLALPLRGVVTLYYELPTFDQTLTQYINSRDDDQLRGVIAPKPSVKCEPYAYDGGKPIVPCGEVADSMFSDYINDPLVKPVKPVKSNKWIKINLLRHGILSAEDKAGFHNPPNMTEVLQNFTKPKSWPAPIYELDQKNLENNGFQNEGFISWMRTDWKRKLVGRFNHSNKEYSDGMPAGEYQIDILYRYPLAKYDGRRKLIFVAAEEVYDGGPYTAGAVLLTLGILAMAAGALIYAKKYLEDIYYLLYMRGNDEETRQNMAPPSTGPSNKERNASPLLTQT